MKPQVVLTLAACAVLALGQTGFGSAKESGAEQPATAPYQRPDAARAHTEKEDFITSSTRLVNKNDVDYGAMLEQRREAFLAASAANPYFWYSALATTILMVLMFAYGVRVMDEKRKLWHAAEILNDVWNDARHARATAHEAITRHNSHMEACNRVIETQSSGRSSPAALETTDARNELTRVRGELDTVDSDRKVLKSKLEDKERMIDELSARLDALEKAGPNGTSTQPRNGNGTPGRNEAESKLIARINQLTEQLEGEKQKNRTLKGA
jgi:hypothetical protein